jgi:predicted cupin superfamily sugar epimerase
VAPGFDFADFTLIDPAGSDTARFSKPADARLVDDSPT